MMPSLTSSYAPELDPSKIFTAASETEARDWARAQTHLLTPRIEGPVDDETLWGIRHLLGFTGIRIYRRGDTLTTSALSAEVEGAARQILLEMAP